MPGEPSKDSYCDCFQEVTNYIQKEIIDKDTFIGYQKILLRKFVEGIIIWAETFNDIRK